MSEKEAGSLPCELCQGRLRCSAPKSELHICPCKFPPCWSQSDFRISSGFAQLEDFLSLATKSLPRLLLQFWPLQGPGWSSEPQRLPSGLTAVTYLRG